MKQPVVAISVDCVCATQGKCFVSKLVDVAEEFSVPLTWLLGVAEHDPLSNVQLYHKEYLHLIPAWHERGLFITFDTGAGSTMARGDVIRMGKDILKQYSIKPTAFRAANGDLEAGDVQALEDIGILIDTTPGSSSERQKGTPRKPYHPNYNHPLTEGDAKLWVLPTANSGGTRAYMEEGFERVKSIIEESLAESDVISIGLCDCNSNADALKKTVAFLRSKHARFVTLTQLVSDLDACD